MSLTAMLLSSTGCATAGDCKLLALRQYTQEQNLALAKEIEVAPQGALWPRVVADYIGLRDAVKACKGE